MSDEKSVLQLNLRLHGSACADAARSGARITGMEAAKRRPKARSAARGSGLGAAKRRSAARRAARTARPEGREATRESQ